VSDQILLGPLILFASVMSLTPGPNVILVTASAANFGFRRTIPMMLGITLGFGLLVVAAGLGLAGLIQAEPGAQAVLRYAGALYLLYLAWCIARAEARNSASPHTKPIGFLEALLLQGVNPKGWVFAFGALAAYTTVAGNVLRETAIIAAINATTCLISVVIWSGFGTLIGRFLRNPRARQTFNWTMAGLLVLSLIPIFW
jgi:threonine/homoserine/homoserine lactone efflux protein